MTDALEAGDLNIVGDFETQAQIACQGEIQGLQILANTSIILEVDDFDEDMSPEDFQGDAAEDEFAELETETTFILASDFDEVEELEEGDPSENDDSTSDDGTVEVTKRDFLSDQDIMIELPNVIASNVQIDTIMIPLPSRLIRSSKPLENSPLIFPLIPKLSLSFFERQRRRESRLSEHWAKQSCKSRRIQWTIYSSKRRSSKISSLKRPTLMRPLCLKIYLKLK